MAGMKRLRINNPDRLKTPKASFTNVGCARRITPDISRMYTIAAP